MKLSYMYEARKTIDRQAVIDLANQGKSNIEIQKLLGISKISVQNILKGVVFTPDVIKKRTESANAGRRSSLEKRKKDPDFIRKHRASLQKLEQDPEFRKRRAETARETMLTLWQRPEFREQHQQRMLQQLADPEYREHIREHMRLLRAKQSTDPEYNERMSQYMSELWNSPEYQGHRERQSQRMKDLWVERGGFWTWIGLFDTEKQIEIITAIAHKTYPDDSYEREALIRAMVSVISPY